MAHFDIVGIGAHPDDLEAVMGGTAAKLAARGRSVLFVDLTDGEPTRYGARGERQAQAHRAATLLGVQRTTLAFPDRLLQDTIEARLQVARLLRDHTPQLVFSTSGSGVHPDHRAVTDLVIAGVFYARLPNWDDVEGGALLAGTQPHEIGRLLFGHCRMEPPWDRFDFAVDITAYHDQKVAALAAYESVFCGDQAALIDKYSVEDRYVGSLVGVKYAEAFRARSPLVLETPELLGPARFG